MIVVEDLHRHFGAFRAVDGASLEIKTGYGQSTEHELRSATIAGDTTDEVTSFFETGSDLGSAMSRMVRVGISRGIAHRRRGLMGAVIPTAGCLRNAVRRGCAARSRAGG